MCSIDEKNRTIGFKSNLFVARLSKRGCVPNVFLIKRALATTSIDSRAGFQFFLDWGEGGCKTFCD